MALIIQKFGGTSVGTLENIQRVAAKILQARAQGHDVVVVVSAMSGETDRLINLAKTIHHNPDPREYAVLISTGEQVSIALLAIALMAQGCPARSFTGAQARIHTDSHHKKAQILEIDARELRNALAAGQVPIVAGFQGISAGGDVTTLGRGGSDTTAVAVAAALQANECQIYTDVAGVYTADPRIVPKARCLEQITFTEMLEFSSLGAKVLQQQAVECAGKYRVPLRVLSTFDEGLGTQICFDEANNTAQSTVTGIAFSPAEAKLCLKGLPHHPRLISDILAALSDAGIEVDMLTQEVMPPDSMNFTFTLPRDDYERALEILPLPLASCKIPELVGDRKIAKLSLVGVGLRSHPAIISTLSKALDIQGILAQLISASEIRASVIIGEEDAERGMRALHTTFGLDEK